MIILLAALTATSNPASTSKAAEALRARATIVRGGEVSSKNWNPGLHPTQRELIKKEQDGRTILIRLTEFE